MPMIDRQHGTGFSAQVVPSLRQGDHSCVMITYGLDDGSVKRIGIMIMPDELIGEFLAHFGIESVSPTVT